MLAGCDWNCPRHESIAEVRNTSSSVRAPPEDGGIIGGATHWCANASRRCQGTRDLPRKARHWPRIFEWPSLSLPSPMDPCPLRGTGYVVVCMSRGATQRSPKTTESPLARVRCWMGEVYIQVVQRYAAHALVSELGTGLDAVAGGDGDALPAV